MSPKLRVATRKGLFTIERNATSGVPWKVTDVAFLGDPVSMLLCEPGAERLHAALKLGHFGVKFRRSIDGGRTWTEAAAPEYPEKPEGVSDLDPFRGQEIPWNLKDVWSLECGHADEPGVLWCGTIPGGLFRSDDGGESWSIVESLWNHPGRKKWAGGGADWAAIHSICVDPRFGGARVCVGVSCGGVWVTEDGGASWEQRAHGMRAEYMPPEQAMDPDTQDPHRIVQCASQPDVYWAQHHNGIFKSVDGAHSWTEIEQAGPSTFGFATVVHPADPDTAWFVPALKDEKRYPANGEVVVTRTRDGGKTFDVLREGLPQEHAYDLVFRHGMDLAPDGLTLAFGSTGGSLWISEDGGESFSTISANLPPIYAVRFDPA